MKYLNNDNNVTPVPENITIKIPKNFNTKYNNQTVNEHFKYCSFILNKNSGDVLSLGTAGFYCDYLIIEPFKVNGEDFYFTLQRTEYRTSFQRYNQFSPNQNDRIIIIDTKGEFPNYMKKLFKFTKKYFPNFNPDEIQGRYWNNFNCRHIETVDLGNTRTKEDWNRYVKTLPYPITVDNFINEKKKG